MLTSISQERRGATHRYVLLPASCKRGNLYRDRKQGDDRNLRVCFCKCRCAMKTRLWTLYRICVEEELINRDADCIGLLCVILRVALRNAANIRVLVYKGNTKL